MFAFSPYCTENEPNRGFKTGVRTEPWFLRTVTPLIFIKSTENENSNHKYSHNF